MTSHRFTEIQINQGIAAEHHEGVIKEWLEILNALEATGGAKGITNQLTVNNATLEAIGYLHTKALAITEVTLNLLG
jgi:hypothetical protein